jgi:CBS domain-containing protein/uncharacterized protein (DUF2267 family)
MELKDFLDKKVVILPENCTVEEAAKAMANQRVGCVVVKSRHKVTGVVTDRDLACHVLAEQRAAETALEDIIAVEDVVSVDEDATVEDVIEQMIHHGVRRIPILKKISHDRQTCIGIITLDDLILNGAVDVETVQEIIMPQVRIFERHQTSRFRRRKEARLEQSQNIFFKTLAREMEMVRNEAEAVIVFLLKNLVERISYTEAADLISSLPKLLQEDLWNVSSGPNRKINSEYILRKMQTKFSFAKPVCERLIRGFWVGLELYLLNNECNHVLSQLPNDMQILFRGESFPKSRSPRKKVRDRLN